MSRLRYYATLLRVRLGMNWRVTIAHRADFVIGNLGIGVQTIAGTATFAVLFSSAGVIRGWTTWEWVFLLGLANTSRALWDTFLIATLDIGDLVREGELDQLVAKPASPLFLVLTSRFDIDTWIEIVLGLAMIAAGLVGAPAEVTVATVGLVVLALAASTLIYACLHLIVQSLAFWITETWFLALILYRLDESTRLPMGYLPRWAVLFLSTLVPLAFVNYWPAIVILDKGPPPYAWLSPVVALLATLVAAALWRRGLRRYTSAG